MNKSGRVWHCWLADEAIRGASYYAYSVDGPDDPAAGLRFDPGKVLLDPYARAVFFPPAFDREAAKIRGSNAGRAPLGVLEASRRANGWEEACRPRHAWDTVVYEMHVRGFTRRDNSGVPADHRGTFAGVIDKVPYLADLGVTVVELLPIYQRDPQELNYWGYMPLNFFAPHAQYAAAGTPEGAIAEMQDMVRALHAAGIEVVLDVVYNPHRRGGRDRPDVFVSRHRQPDVLPAPGRSQPVSQRRGDRQRHAHREHGRPEDGGGQHAVLGARHARRRVPIRSASIFTRRTDGSLDLDDPPMVWAIDADPEFKDMRLIAEAWDLGSYLLGRLFPGVEWCQWNDRFRDDVRAFVRGDSNTVASLMTRIYGRRTVPDGLRYLRARIDINFGRGHDGSPVRPGVDPTKAPTAANEISERQRQAADVAGTAAAARRRS